MTPEHIKDTVKAISGTVITIGTSVTAHLHPTTPEWLESAMPYLRLLSVSVSIGVGAVTFFFVLEKFKAMRKINQNLK